MTDYCPDGQVVYTPPAKAREGLLGYVLRVSEDNGYDSPWHIFALAGMSQSEMTIATLPIDKLSKVIGRSVQELARLPWQCYPNGDPLPPMSEGRPQVLGHLLLKHPKICPHCIAESGVVDAAWDLRIMLACPKHGAALVDRCPACQRKLTWFRRGLDRCRCGHRLTADEQSSFPQHTLDLLQIIYDTLHGLPTNPTPPSGIPASNLQRMGIDDLLRLLTKVDNALTGNEPKGKYAAYPSDRLVRLSGFFEDWPRQFHRFLRTIDPTPDQATMGLARRFGYFYSGVVTAKSIPRDKMVFFRAAFGQYASYDGVTPGADPRFFLTPSKWRALREQGLSPAQIRLQTKGAGAPNNVVNRTELARRLGVQPITARRWAEHGLLGLARQGTLASGQIVYKTPIKLPRKVTAGTMDARNAAKYLGIPVSVLARLRRDGYYRVVHLGVYLAQFNQLDLNTLRTDFLARVSQTLPALPPGHITLRAFFRMRVNGVENKYQIVRGILDGSLVPAGRLGDSIGDIVIAGESIKAFREDMSIHDTIASSIAAKVLECDPSICVALVARGELQGIRHGRFLFVTTQSVAAFQEKYVSCVSIAKRLGSSSRHVTRLLADRGADLLRVLRTYRSNKTEQVFCPREHAKGFFGSSVASPVDQQRRPEVPS